MMDSTPDYTKWFALAGEGTAPFRWFDLGLALGGCASL